MRFDTAKRAYPRRRERSVGPPDLSRLLRTNASAQPPARRHVLLWPSKRRRVGTGAAQLDELRESDEARRGGAPTVLDLVRNARDFRCDRRGCSPYRRDRLAQSRRALAGAPEGGDQLAVVVGAVGVDSEARATI